MKNAQRTDVRGYIAGASLLSKHLLRSPGRNITREISNARERWGRARGKGQRRRSYFRPLFLVRLPQTKDNVTGHRRDLKLTSDWLRSESCVTPLRGMLQGEKGFAASVAKACWFLGALQKPIADESTASISGQYEHIYAFFKRMVVWIISGLK